MGLEDILGFDPYMRLGVTLLRTIYSNGHLDYNVLLQISECYPDKHSHFEHILFGNTLRYDYFIIVICKCYK